MTLKEIIKTVVATVLKKHGGNKYEACRELDISSSKLQSIIQEPRLPRPDPRQMEFNLEI